MDIAEILDEYREYDVEYHHQFTNHLPMALIALYKMGAPEERLHQFASLYVKRLKRIVILDLGINNENWRNYIGEHKYYHNYIQFFTSEFERLGKEEFLRLYLAELFNGVAAGAFHALIKLAYAIHIDKKKEIIDAISYLAISHLPLIEIDEKRQRNTEPLNILKEFSEDTYFKRQEYGGFNIAEKMKTVAADPYFKRKIALIDEGQNILEKSADAVIRLFANSFNFTALHTVTATHAVRIVMPYISEGYMAINYFWRAILAAYITIKTPALEIKDIENREELEWEDILGKASESNDEHVIKLVYSCFEENKIYQNPLYRVVAAKELEFIA